MEQSEAGLSIEAQGLLSNRLLKNYGRLEDPIYHASSVFQADGNNWPGDWEGRTILALMRLYEATGRRPVYLGGIIERLSREWNEKGYLKDILPEGEFSEQAFSGHNWLIRGLEAYYRKTKDERVRGWLDRIVDNLYLPACGAYRKYPVAPEERVYEGDPDGNLTGCVINGWHTSSDTGCAFICLDGLSSLYLHLGMERLKPLLTEMIERFLTIDFTGISMQTHATLSGLRGILNFYEATGEACYLDEVRRIFRLYTDQGMTLNYANYNWFCRPTWTEPCAIADSMMLALRLYRLTGDSGYLRLFQRIYFNGFLSSQRANGGFGGDVCATPAQPDIKAEFYEAFWCCTMRGAEGLAEAKQALAFWDGGTLVLGLYDSCAIRAPGLSITEASRYPEEGRVSLRIKNDRETPLKLRLYLPENAAEVTLTLDGSPLAARPEDGFLTCTVPAGESLLALNFTTPAVRVPFEGAPGKCLLFEGDILLAQEKGRERPAPLYQNYWIPKEEYADCVFRILFDQTNKGESL